LNKTTLKNKTLENKTLKNPASENRLDIVNLMAVNLVAKASTTEREGQDVIAGLSASAKSLPPKYFYDEQGSQLFEQICELPEYYPTRTETAILKAFGSAIAHITGPCEIAELGSGSATKTRLLLNAYQTAGHRLHYLPIDVSNTMLIETADKLLSEYPTLSIYAIASTYEPALKALPQKQLTTRMIAFIGSTIGNLQPHECEAFLACISATLASGDYFLLGLDLQKEPAILEAAYNDAQGVTAKFNLNMLRHLNRQFEGDFNLNQFTHFAKYNKQLNQIEMYLESLTAQTVRLKGLDLTVEFEKGDRILSEISRKFNLDEMVQSLSSHSLNVVETFTDSNRWFGMILAQRVV
jgi:L-histidine Nalpha-methyltransferase